MKDFEKYKESGPFKIPENYFEEFPEKLSQKLEQETNGKRLFSKFIFLKPYITIAASFLIVYGLWYLFLNNSVVNDISDNEEIQMYEDIEFLLEDIENQELMSLYADFDTTNVISLAYTDDDFLEILDDIDESVIIESF